MELIQISDLIIQSIRQEDEKVHISNIEGFKNYLIFSDGRIFSIKRNLFLNPEITNAGYQRVNLYSNGKRYHKSIHRVVAEAFIPNPDNLPIVNHNNENKLDNNADNLEWVSIEENTKYGTALLRRAESQKASMSTRKPVVCYDKDMNEVKEYLSIRDAVRQTGISHIGDACKGTYHMAGGYYWQYK